MMRKAALAWLLFMAPFFSLHALDYTVQRNDTLWGISRRFGVSVDTLVRLNQLYGEVLSAGQKIGIPSRVVEYQVKPGDTLSELAVRLDSRLAWIIIYNNLAGEILRDGHQLLIPIELRMSPGETNSLTEQKGETLAGKAEWLFHPVASGETLTAIAKKYQVSLSSLRTWNHKNSDALYAGEKLKIQVKSAEQVGDSNISGSRYEKMMPNQAVSTHVREFSDPLKPETSNGRPLSVHTDKRNPEEKEETLRFPFDRSVVRSVETTARGMNFQLTGACRVYAMGAGEVQWAGQIRGFNNVVILSHPNGKTTIYGYLVRLDVSKGMQVKSGEGIGQTGWLSYLNGARFYMEIRKDGIEIPPSRLFPFLKPNGMVAKKE